MYTLFISLSLVISVAQTQFSDTCFPWVNCPCGATIGNVSQVPVEFCRDTLLAICCKTVPPLRSQNQVFEFDDSGSSGENQPPVDSIPLEAAIDAEPAEPTTNTVMSEPDAVLSEPDAVLSEPDAVLSEPFTNEKNLSSSTDILPEDSFKFSGRISGGEQSRPHKHAWLVWIKFKPQPGSSGAAHCGGTLISWYFVLTTAHCYFEDSGERRYINLVRLGHFSLLRSERFTFERREEISFLHPDYRHNPNSFTDDIALIKLDASAKVNEAVYPAYLPRDTERVDRFTDLWARVAGWGGKGPTELYNENIRETCLQVKEQCCQHHFKNFDSSKQMCLLGTPFTDVCRGDSGSPFVMQNFLGPTIIALVSFGTEFCLDGRPTVNTAVQYYMPWIRGILRQYEPDFQLFQKRNHPPADIACRNFECPDRRNLG